MKTITCDICGKKIYESCGEWNKLMMAKVRETVSVTFENKDLCPSCVEKVRDFIKKSAKQNQPEQHKICRNCGKEIVIDPIGHKYGKTLCQDCLDRLNKHKPDRDAMHY